MPSTTYGYLVATLGVTLATALLHATKDVLNDAHVGLVFLLIVAAAAAAGGTRPALLAALLAFLCWNFFFLHPFHTLYLTDPRDWILLVVFLVIGVLVGQITGRLRLREEEAKLRERQTAALYRASEAAAAYADGLRGLSVALAPVMESVGAAAAVVYVPGQGGRMEPLVTFGGLAEDVGEAAGRVHEEAKAVGLAMPPASSAQGETSWPVSVPYEAVGAPDRGDVYLPLATAQRAYGVLHVKPQTGLRFDAEACRVLVTLAGQASILLERRRLLDEATGAAAQQEAERLRSTLLSSLSHDLKTPLASLTTTLSSLRGEDVEWSKALLRENLDLMAVDLDRLSASVDNLLNLAQLESGSWKPQQEPIELSEPVSVAMRLLRPTEAARVRIGELGGNPMVEVDVAQMAQVIRHLLENAFAYSPPGSEVVLDADARGDRVVLWVDDVGDGVPVDEREVIFRKFYRGRAARAAAVRGTGLGLAICREIVAAHGGTIHVESAPTGGARFVVSLPGGSVAGIEQRKRRKLA